MVFVDRPRPPVNRNGNDGGSWDVGALRSIGIMVSKHMVWLEGVSYAVNIVVESRAYYASIPYPTMFIITCFVKGLWTPSDLRSNPSRTLMSKAKRAQTTGDCARETC